MKFVLFVAVLVFLGASASPSDNVEEFTPYVINGARAPIAPYFVFVQYFNAQLHGFFGGGALISTRHIVTAASNVHNFNSIRVHMGSTNRTALREFAVNMANINVHPQYNPVSRANDIAVLRLTTPIIPTAEIQPIVLPPMTNPQIELPWEFEEGHFSGFGFQNIASTGPSQSLYRGFQRVTTNIRCSSFFIISTTTGFCAEDTVERSNGCPGDVGNPFVTTYRRIEVLSGILSMHPPCGQQSPAAYTRITAYRLWLQEQLMI